VNDNDVVGELRQARDNPGELKHGQAPRVESKVKKKLDAWIFYIIALVCGLSVGCYVYFAVPRFSEKFLWIFKLEHSLFKIPYSSSWFEIAFTTGLFAMAALFVMPIILVVIYDASQNKNNKTPKSEMDAHYYKNLILMSPALFGAALTCAILKVPALFHRVLTVNVYMYGIIWIIMTGWASYLMSLLLITIQESQKNG
jgi:hypothetical protein